MLLPGIDAKTGAAQAAAPRVLAPTLALALAIGLAGAARAAGDPTQMSLEQLLDVRVVGASKYEQRQSEVGAAVSVITRSEIQAFGWRTLDQALASLPGVYTTYDRQYVYLGVRGFGLPGDYNTRVLVTINGNRVNDPTFDTGPFGRLFPVDMDMVERIEFIPGPGGAVYGQNAMLGVVNVVTRDGADLNGTELAAGAQQPQFLREARASWGQRYDSGLDLALSASEMNSRGQNLFMEYAYTPDAGIAAGMDSDHTKQFQARAALGAWSFELVYGLERKGDPTGSFFSDPLVPNQYVQTAYTLTQLQYQDTYVADTLHVTARLFTGSMPEDTHYYYGTLYGFPVVSDWWGGEARVVSTANAAHTWMVGVEAQDNYHVDQADIDYADPAQDVYLRNAGYRAGLYAQDEWHLSPSLDATVGARLDRNNVIGDTWSPRLALVWQADPATTAKALYGVAHRAPNAYEDSPGYASAQSTLGLSGETIDTLELVIDRRVSADFAAHVSVYEWRLRDLLLQSVQTDEFQNSPRVGARGVELAADRTWDSGARLRGSVAVQGAGFDGGPDLPNSPHLLAKLYESTPLPVAGLHLGAALRYDGPRLALNGDPIGGYTLADLNLATAALARGLDVSLGVENLFDKHYMEPAGPNNWQWVLPQDGRSVALRLRLSVL